MSHSPQRQSTQANSLHLTFLDFQTITTKINSVQDNCLIEIMAVELHLGGVL